MPGDLIESHADIARRRLAAQHLTKPVKASPRELVARLGAVQAQDYAGAKWAIGQRLLGADDATLERAMADGSILRTHVLRPTWHFVAPADIRWMLDLTGPRVIAMASYQFRRLELDEATFRRSRGALTKALQGGKQLTRFECGAALERAKISLDGLQRLGHLLMRAELDGVICSGARRGKQLTYALLEERVPPAPPKTRDEALVELAQRYFPMRGPATLNDFSWWSGLTVADARRAVEAAKLESLTINAKSYWRTPGGRAPTGAGVTANLLPNYDEYFIGFRDRSALRGRVNELGPADPLNANLVVIDGEMVGVWRRALEGDSVVVSIQLVDDLTSAERTALERVVARYGDFLGLAARTCYT